MALLHKCYLLSLVLRSIAYWIDYSPIISYSITFAARIITAIRERARNRHPDTNPNGEFDSVHIRRGDFQYKQTRIEADEIYKNVEDQLTENATVYIATDERNKDFFKPLEDHYDVVYFDDFKHLIEGLNTNYYGMLDQLITSRGRVFFGTFYSTFSGYISRLRGRFAWGGKQCFARNSVMNFSHVCLMHAFCRVQLKINTVHIHQVITPRRINCQGMKWVSRIAGISCLLTRKTR